MNCNFCEHMDVCKNREEYEYLNNLYRNAMQSYKPDFNKPKLSDIPYINIPDLKCEDFIAMPGLIIRREWYE